MKRSENLVQLHNITNFNINQTKTISIDEYKEYYKHMTIIRLMEEYLENEFKKGNVRGFCHLVIGQEGIYAALMRMHKKNMKNKFIASYRCHGVAYATGSSVREIVAEILGLYEGLCRGKGGSMHLYNDNFYGGHGIVGAQVPLGTGLAYSIKYKKYMTDFDSKNFSNESKEDFYTKSRQSFIDFQSDAVCYAIYGDGASNQGQVYESFNMAKLYNLPIVFIVENNKYGMYTQVNNVSLDDNFYKRGYGIPGIRISDNDIFILQETLQFSEEYAKKNGPIIVQIDTYRLCGHAANDVDQFYRTTDEFNKEAEMDCLKNLEIEMAKNIEEDDLIKFKEEIKNEFLNEINAIDFEKKPGHEDLYTDLFYKK